MDLVTLPHGLALFYGALVLSCGIGLGVIFARVWARMRDEDSPPPAELLQRRVDLLEEDLDMTDVALRRLLDERDAARESRPPGTHLTAA